MGHKMATSLTGNVASSVVVAEHPGENINGSKAVVLTTTVGATPTVKVDIQGSVDNVTWFNIPYALPATPTVFVTTQITITTADTFIYLLSDPAQPNPYAFVRILLSANTNVTVLRAEFFL
jgi:hypothetical protein